MSGPFRIVTTMPRLSKVEQERAIGKLEAGGTLKRVAMRFIVAVSTTHRLRRRVNDTGVTDIRRRLGAPGVTTHAQDRYMGLQLLRYRLQSATRIATQTIGLHNCFISGQTVRNRLREHGLRTS